MTYFIHWFYLLRSAVWLNFGFLHAVWYFANKVLSDLEIPNTRSLSSKALRRLQHYYYGTTYLSIIFCALRGRPRQFVEKRLFTNLAALAYFFDDLVDETRRKGIADEAWFEAPEAYGQATDESGLALHFLQNVLRDLPPHHVEQFRAFMHRVFEVETQGRQQGDHQLTVAELEQITAQKGGYSVLMFRRMLAHDLPATEEEALFQFGCLIQLCDDIYDLWFDLQDGISTLATHYLQDNNSDVDSLNQRFEAQVQRTQAAFRKAPYNKLRIGTSLRVVHAIVVITRVCLRHYAKLRQQKGQLPLQDRRQMVVDMEQWPNRLRAVLYWLKP
jgi:hypothetical protein